MSATSSALGIRRRLRRGVMLLAVLAMVAAACGDSSADTSAATQPPGQTTTTGPSGPEVTDITFVDGFLPWPGSIPIYFARDLGYFTEEGLNVTIQTPIDSSTAGKLVGVGQAQMGFSRGIQIVDARDKGVPLVGVGEWIPNALEALFWRHDDDRIQEPADLAGMIIGESSAVSTQALITDFLNNVGLSGDDVERVDAGFGATRLLLAGQIDVAFAGIFPADGDNYLQQTGSEPGFFMLTDYGVPNIPYYTIITNDTFARDNPEAVRAFLRGAYRGLEYARANPDEVDPKLHEVSEGTPLDTGGRVWAKVEPFMTDDSGVFDADQWRTLRDWMCENQFVTTAYDPGEYVTNAYLDGPEIDFDLAPEQCIEATGGGHGGDDDAGGHGGGEEEGGHGGGEEEGGHGGGEDTGGEEDGGHGGGEEEGGGHGG